LPGRENSTTAVSPGEFVVCEFHAVEEFLHFRGYVGAKLLGLANEGEIPGTFVGAFSGDKIDAFSEEMTEGEKGLCFPFADWLRDHFTEVGGEIVEYLVLYWHGDCPSSKGKEERKIGVDSWGYFFSLASYL